MKSKHTAESLRMCAEMIWYWVFLLLAIGCEVSGTTFMKLSDGFSKLVPSVLVVAFYILTLPFYTLALKKIDVSVAYAVWSGVGTSAIALVGWFLFREQMNATKIAALVLIVIGIVMLNFSGVNR